MKIKLIPDPGQISSYPIVTIIDRKDLIPTASVGHYFKSDPDLRCPIVVPCYAAPLSSRAVVLLSNTQANTN